MTGSGEVRGGADSSDVLYFFCQEDPNKNRSLRRAKIVLDEQTLLALSPKKNLSSLAKLSQELDPNASLADRLAAVLKAAGANTLMASLANASAAAKPGASFASPSRSQIEWDNSAAINYSYTDTRLQAIRYLTDEMIRELDETVVYYAESEGEKNLALPAQVICDWHADWTDLTERADYSRFPTWQTKNGKDGGSSSHLTAHGHKSKKLGGGKKDERKKSKAGFRRNSSMDSPETILEESPRKQSHQQDKDRSSHASIKPPANKLMRRRTSSKVSSIIELNTSRGQSTSRMAQSIHGNQRASAMKNHSPSSLRPGSNINMLLNKPDLTNSRVINSQNSTTFALNYQLSNKVFREKGWTVLKIEREEMDHMNERRIIDYLNSSMQSINDSRNYIEHFGLTKPCKVRFYGDHRKDQIEKYKSTHLRPKKTAFAMSILRYEIPRPLDLQYMLDVISNPNLAQLATLAPTSYETAMAQLGGGNKPANNSLSRPGSSLSSVSFNLPKPPPLLSTHTNDGTTCIYYPNGQLAVVVANVFGFFVESASSSSAANGNPLYQNAQSMFTETAASKQANQNSSLSGGGSSTMTNYNLCLKCQPLKDSFTTIVYDRQQQPPRPSLIRVPTIIKEPLIPESNDENSKSNRRTSTKPSSREKQRLLCVISSLGYCVVYRRNGLPRFICSEFGGCLCNRAGNVYYQWKWDEVKLRDYERFKNELLINLNENIRLEYRNPSNIRLKYSCDKEIHEFDLGCTKPNSARLHEMLNRTVSDFPMQSKLGQIKIATNAKSAVLQTYKQHHAQQQQQAAHSIRKSSVIINQSFRGSKNPSPSDEAVESLLESMVSYRDVPAMKDLLTTQKKIRNLLDEWLNYCRTSLNIMQPDMYILPELKNRSFGINALRLKNPSPLLDRSKSKSAEVLRSPLDFIDLTKIISSADKMSNLARSKSALIGLKPVKMNNSEKMKIYKSLLSSRSDMAGTSMTTSRNKKAPGQMWSSFDPETWTSSRRGFGAGQSTSRSGDLNGLLNLSPRRPYFNNIDLNLMCPVSVHNKLAFNAYEVAECRCRKLTTPIVRDLEFDYFIRLLPPQQLAVVVVVDSENKPNRIQEIVDELYVNANRARLQPCKESIRDESRYLVYDLRCATEHSDHTVPLLRARHNIAPGMVLIYQNSKLLFCDHIFNGYGYSEQDFLKQLSRSREDGKSGKILPYNFRFDRPTGKHGRRTAWGGQIGGIDPCLVDNFTEENVNPIKDGSSSPTTHNKLALDNSKSPSEPIYLPKIAQNSSSLKT